MLNNEYNKVGVEEITECYEYNLKMAKELSTDYKKREKMIQFLFDKFNKEYLSQDIGIAHKHKYGSENEEVNRVYNEIIEKRSNGEDYSDDVFDRLLNRTYQVHWDNRSKAIKSFLAKDYNDDEIKEVAIYFIDLIEAMLKDGKKYPSNMKNYIKKLRENSKYLAVNRVSSILYYLDEDDFYYVINSKTVDTVRLLSIMIVPEIKFKRNINNYINENIQLHSFLTTLSYYVKELGEFETFDMFCHWMCDKNLGSYARLDAVNKLPNIEDI